MSAGRSLIGGFAGAVALTAFHQFFRNKLSFAPRMDEMGMVAIQKLLGNKAPKKEINLYKMSLYSDLISNGIGFSIAALSRRNPLLVSTIVGLGMGVGATTLPEKMGLKKEFTAANLKMGLMSLFYYTSGSLISGSLIKAFR